MRKFLAVIAALFVVVVAAGLVFLATWDIPAPTAPVEKTIPDDKLPH
jgi:hypothetical protein